MTERSEVEDVDQQQVARLRPFDRDGELNAEKSNAIVYRTWYSGAPLGQRVASATGHVP